MRNPFLAAALAALALIGSGCSLLSATRPESEIRLSRSAIERPWIGGEYLKPGDTLLIGNEWAGENVSVTFTRKYHPGAGSELSEILAEESFEITRLTDPAVAGDVAKERARQTRLAGGDVARTVAVLGSVYAGMASGGLSAVIPAVQSAVEGMSRDRQEIVAEQIAAVLANEALTQEQKAEAIRALVGAAE